MESIDIEDTGLKRGTERTSVLQLTDKGLCNAEVSVAREFPLTIILNNQDLVTLLCTPTDLDYLAVGFLFVEELIKNKDEINSIAIDDLRGIAMLSTKEDKEIARELSFKQLISSSYNRGASIYSSADKQQLTRVESSTLISTAQVLALVEEFEERSAVYKATHGVHSAALCDTNNILVFSNDLGRHNAIDKVFGECILKGIPIEDRIVITSGRTPSEMVYKVARGKIPILISVGAPTCLGIRLARDLGITMIGFVRGGNMNVYTGSWRIMDCLDINDGITSAVKR